MIEKIITFKDFAGTNNRNDPMRVDRLSSRFKHLVTATNCDIDNDRMLSRRAGYAQVIDDTGFHSMWANSTICLLVQDTILKRMYEDYSLESLKTGLTSGRIMSYADMKDGRIAVTNSDIIGYVQAGAYNDMPTPTIQFRIKPYPGQLIEWYNGRLYIARGDRIYYTDPYALRMRLKKNYIQTSGHVTLLKAVDDGLWIADGKIHFLSGPSPLKFTWHTKTDYNAIIHSAKSVLRDLVGKDGLTSPSIWTGTEKGVAVLGNSGSFKNITIKYYTMPAGKTGAGLYRESGNKSQFLVTLEN